MATEQSGAEQVPLVEQSSSPTSANHVDVNNDDRQRHSSKGKVTFGETNRSPSTSNATSDTKRHLSESRAFAIIFILCLIIIGLGTALIVLWSSTDEGTSPSETTQSSSSKQEESPSSHDDYDDDSSSKNEAEDCAAYPWNNMRLPTAAHPAHYDLFIQPNISQRAFTGSVTITLNITQATDLVVLHTNALDVTRVEVSSDAAISVVQQQYCAAHEQLMLTFSQTLLAGRQYEVLFAFNGNITENLVGLYLSSITNERGVEEYSAVTQMEPIDARRMLPCFDEPMFKATFSVQIKRESAQISRSNMPQISSIQQPDGLWLDKYDKTVPMSTYLLAIAVGDYVYKSQQTKRSNITVSILTPKHLISNVGYPMMVALKGLDFFEEYFDIPYPLPKQDMIALGDFSAAAMENWGLITYKDFWLVVDKVSATAVQMHDMVTVVLHELAHQWFGNLVTMKWWDDIWLNEGFATFMEYIATDAVHKEWNNVRKIKALFGKQLDQIKLMFQRAAFYMDNIATGQHMDALLKTHPVSNQLKDPAQITSVFDAITYQKGASIIAMIEYLVGRESFRRALHHYLDKYRYANAASSDLWDVIGQYLSADDAETLRRNDLTLETVATAWTNNVGYPVVDVKVDRANQQIVLSQRRFVYLSDDAGYAPDDSQLWPIPISYFFADGGGNATKVYSTWLTERQKAIPLSKAAKAASWVQFNVGGNGFYRVLYDDNNYDALIEQIRTDRQRLDSPFDARHGHQQEQMPALLLDTFSLARSGQLDIGRAFDLLEYLTLDSHTHLERSTNTWRVLTQLLNDIDAWLDMSDARPLLHKFIRRILTNGEYGRLGWNEGEGRPPLPFNNRRTQASVLSLACHLRVPDCIEKALSRFQQWKKIEQKYKDDPDRVAKNAELYADLLPDFLSAVVNTGVQEGGVAEWEFVFDAFRRETSPANKFVYLEALGRTQTPWLINRLLESALNDSLISRSNMPRVAAAAVNNPLGKQAAWKFVKKNWLRIDELIGETSLVGRLVLRTLEGFSSDYDYNDAKRFFAKRDLRKNEQKITQSLELMQINVKWVQRHETAVISWLQKWEQRQQASKLLKV